MRLRTAFAALFAVPALACGAIAGFEALDYYDPSVADGGDGAADAPVGPTDGASEDAADAAPACTHDFCDDFEGITKVEQRWTALEVVGTGQLGLFVEDGGNTTMRSSIQHVDSGTVVHIARVSKQDQSQVSADGTMPPVTIAFRLKVETADSNRSSIAGVVIGNDDGGGGEDSLSLELALDDGAKDTVDLFFQEIYFLDGGANYAGKTSNLTIPIGEWTDVELHVNGRPPGVNGGAVLTVGDASDSYGLASSSRPKYVRIDIGHGTGTLAGATFTSYVDDVKLDYKK